MDMITGQGRPRTDTVGALGTLYKDLKSNDIYECTMAYRASSFEPYTYEWRQLIPEEIVERNIEFPKAQKPEFRYQPEHRNKETVPNTKGTDTVKQPEKQKPVDYTAYNKK